MIVKIQILSETEMPAGVTAMLLVMSGIEQNPGPPPSVIFLFHFEHKVWTKRNIPMQLFFKFQTISESEKTAEVRKTT